MGPFKGQKNILKDCYKKATRHCENYVFWLNIVHIVACIIPQYVLLYIYYSIIDSIPLYPGK